MRYLSDRKTIYKDKLIVRCDGANLPSLGDILLDQNHKPLAQVFDIIGPINSPWIVAKLRKDAIIKDDTLIHVETRKKGKRVQKRPRKSKKMKSRSRT